MKRKAVIYLMLSIIPLEKIQVPENRLSSQLDPEQMEGLMESINRLGLINPVSVKESNGQYILIAGMNRLLALSALGKATAPAFVYTGDDTPINVINISENLHRGNTNPMDEAVSIRDLMNIKSYTLEFTAQMLGRSQEWLKGRLELLSLPDDLQADLRAKRLSIAVCTQLAYVSDLNLRRQIATRAIDYSASAKTVKQWVDTILGTPLTQQARVHDVGKGLLQAKDPDVTLECLSCHTLQTPYAFTSELICSGCKAKMSSQSGAGPTEANPGPDWVPNPRP